MQGKVIWELLIPERYVEPVKGVFANLAHMALPSRFENPWLTKEGKERVISWSNSVVTDAKGKVTQVIGTGLDVTEQRRAEQELAESEKQFRLFYEEAPLGYQSLDADGRILTVNRAWLDLLGYTSAEVVGRSFADFIVPEKRDQFPARFARFKAAGEVHGIEWEMLRKDGSVVWTEQRNTHIYDDRGELAAIEGVARDVTERKQAEDRLRESEELYRSLVEFTNAAVVRYDLEGRRTFVNEAFVRRHGKPAEELLKGRLADQMVPEDAEKERVLFRQCIATGEPVRGIISRHLKKGHTLYTRADFVPIKDSTGEMTGVQGTSVDVTELVETQQALRQGEILYVNLLEATGAAFIRVNREGRRTFAMGAISRMFGQTNEEFLAGKFGDGMLPEDRDKAQALLRETFEAGAPRKGVISRGVAGDGIRYHTSDWHPIRNEKGEVVEVQATVLDITDQLRTEQRRMQVERLEAMGTMAGGIAHDVNNSLAMIALWASIAEGKTQEAGMQEALRNIVQATHDCAESMRRLRRFAQPARAGRYERVNLNDIARECIEFTKPMWKDEAQVKDIHITVRDELVEVPDTMGNAAELRESVVNLITNAVEAMPRGGTISFATYTEGERVCLAVSDTGTGIPEEIVTRIFDPFFTTKGGEGSGLGLSAVRGIVTAHGGEIDVQTAVGRGSTFILRLPAAEKPADRDANARAKPRQGRMVAAEKHTILVVEDERLVREAAVAILKAQGHEVVSAGDGLTAIRAFQQQPVDVVLLDMGLPGMNGYRVAEEIRRLRPHMPIILVTGWGADADREKIKALGVEKVVGKPYEPAELLGAVEDVLVKRRRHP